VLGHTVIPNDDGALFPLHAYVEVGTLCDMIVKEFENRVGFLSLETDDLSCDFFFLGTVDQLCGLASKVETLKFITLGNYAIKVVRDVWPKRKIRHTGG
jgi:hypothetical protein